MPKKINIYVIDDVDHVAATSKLEALEYYELLVDLKQSTTIRKLTDEELNKFKFVENLYNANHYQQIEKTFRQKLDELIAAKENFPTMFASSEY